MADNQFSKDEMCVSAERKHQHTDDLGADRNGPNSISDFTWAFTEAEFVIISELP